MHPSEPWNVVVVGFVKNLTRTGSLRILNAAVVAEQAGEIIGKLVLAMRKGLGVEDLAGMIHPYPTQAEAIKRAAAGCPFAGHSVHTLLDRSSTG